MDTWLKVIRLNVMYLESLKNCFIYSKYKRTELSLEILGNKAIIFLHKLIEFYAAW